MHLWELQSPAYRSLCPAARCVLLELKALYNGLNNGDLFLSVREAARRVGIGKTLAASCFRELRERGFITVSKPGAFNMKATSRRGDATAWLLTEFPPGDGMGVGSKDFMRWSPPEPADSKAVDGPCERTPCPSQRTGDAVVASISAEVSAGGQLMFSRVSRRSAQGHTDKLPWGRGHNGQARA